MQNFIRAYYDFWFGVNEAYEQWAKQRGLTANALFVLYTIFEQPKDCTQRLICERLLLPKQTVNTILDGLEKKGLVYRRPAETDKRNKLVCFTEDGQAFAQRLLGELAEAEGAALGAMTVSQRQAFMESSEIFLHELRGAFARQQKEE